MADRVRNEAAIVERVGELAKSCGIEVKQISYRPMSFSLDRKMELTVFLDTGDNKQLHEIKILVEDIDKYHSGSDVRMRVDREIELALGAIDS
jgi:intergrase/recombinase